MFAPSGTCSALDGEELQNDRATAETNHEDRGRAVLSTALMGCGRAADVYCGWRCP